MENEPFPVEGGKLWSYGCPQWLERYEYIERRAETYLDNFRENPLYDFSRMDKDVEESQKQLVLAYEEFAGGSYTIARVKGYVTALRDSFKRPIQPERIPAPPPRNYAKEAWERKQKLKNHNPQAEIEEAAFNLNWNYSNVMAIREENARREILRQMWSKRIIDGFNPLKGKVCVTLCGGFAFDEHGQEIPEQEATRRIDAELRAEIWSKPLPFRIDDTDLKTPVNRPPPPPLTSPKAEEKPLTEKERLEKELSYNNIKTAGRSLDDLKREQEQLKHTRRFNKLKD